HPLAGCAAPVRLAHTRVRIPHRAFCFRPVQMESLTPEDQNLVQDVRSRSQVRPPGLLYRFLFPGRYPPRFRRSRAEQGRVQVLSMDEILKRGRARRATLRPPKPEDLSTV